MYCEYFRLKEHPFSLSPDPRFLFLSNRHREGLAHLSYGIQQSGGFVQLTGEIGSGKTTLCRSLVRKLPPDTDIALIVNPRMTAFELLAGICDELGVSYPPETRSIKALVDALNRRLLDAYGKGRRTVLVIDEAQNLHSDVLEQIRLLTNLETAQEKLLQIILIGQPELLTVLRQDKLQQLAQRITARYHLTPLSRLETYAYIRHRLSVAGRRDPLFTAPALFHVYRLSGGVPRLVNIICDRALLGAYAHDSQLVTAGIVRRAHRETRGIFPWYRRVRAGWAAGLVALGVLTFGSVIFLGTDAGSLFRRSRSEAGAGTAVSVPEPGGPESDGKPVKSDPKLGPGIIDAPQAREADAAGLHHPADAMPVGAQKAEVAVSQPAGEPGIGADTGAPHLADILADPSLRGTGSSSFASLYSRLGIKLPSGQSSFGCKVENDPGFDCLSRVGNWTKLRNYDLPAILKLTLPSGTQVRVTLVSLGEKSATLAAGGREYTFSLDEIDKFWDGSFTLLWKLPFPPRQVAPGDRGEEVVWIRKTLDTLRGKDPGTPASDVYDETLRRQVVTFQRDRSLPEDGVVGNVTLVRLTLALMGANAPTLSHHSP